MSEDNFGQPDLKPDQDKIEEEAIAAYQVNLAVYSREGRSKEWADTHYLLGKIYIGRARSGHLESAELAITHLEAALTVYSREAFPREHAQTRIALAAAYLRRSVGDRAENLQNVITHVSATVDDYILDILTKPQKLTAPRRSAAAPRDVFKSEDPAEDEDGSFPAKPIHSKEQTSRATPDLSSSTFPDLTEHFEPASRHRAKDTHYKPVPESPLPRSLPASPQSRLWRHETRRIPPNTPESASVPDAFDESSVVQRVEPPRGTHRARRFPSAKRERHEASYMAGPHSRSPFESEIGRLVENIPRDMRTHISNIVEVRIGRKNLEALSDGVAGHPVSHDIQVAKAMSVRLRAPDGGFLIEPISTETMLWIDSEKTLAMLKTEYASWRWRVVPLQRGKRPLNIVVSAAISDASGILAETTLPDQVIEVYVRINYGRTSRRLLGWATAAALGGMVHAWGQHHYEGGLGGLSDWGSRAQNALHSLLGRL